MSEETMIIVEHCAECGDKCERCAKELTQVKKETFDAVLVLANISSMIADWNAEKPK